jgi:hypothetical protein
MHLRWVPVLPAKRTTNWVGYVQAGILTHIQCSRLVVDADADHTSDSCSVPFNRGKIHTSGLVPA